ncbi:ClpXP adapter SpxH family protein [Bacillus taeanensis]|uniref:ClpXP adapter SpxH family protein n=1 Tax=Bacillus taeanensis TaxID=273032 RepID=UPI0026D1C44E
MIFFEAGSNPNSRLENRELPEPSNISQHCSSKKPIEIYTFIDPLCPECWALEPIVKKLQAEYGHYIKFIYLIGSKLDHLNTFKKKNLGIHRCEDVAIKWEKTANRTGMSCNGDLWHEDPISTPYIASIAIKAAELQGKKAGVRFLRKMREFLFLAKQNITREPVIMECAKEAGLDLKEFQKDLHSEGALRAFQCDLKISCEMEVEELPTLVFFNERVEDEGLKVTGNYAYNVYVSILTEMLGEAPKTEEPPPIEEFLKNYKFVATKEISVVYDVTCTEVEREMKKLVLKQKVERVPVKYGTFWRYIE